MRLVCLIIFFEPLSLAVRGVTIDLTPDELTWNTYNPAKILKTANKLIALGPQDAYASLLKYVELPRGIILNDDLLRRDNWWNVELHPAFD